MIRSLIASVRIIFPDMPLFLHHVFLFLDNLNPASSTQSTCTARILALLNLLKVHTLSKTLTLHCPYTVQVDEKGNANVQSLPFSLKVDYMPPQVMIVSSAPEPYVSLISALCSLLSALCSLLSDL
jgi:hypothetical protein